MRPSPLNPPLVKLRRALGQSQLQARASAYPLRAVSDSQGPHVRFTDRGFHRHAANAADLGAAEAHLRRAVAVTEERSRNAFLAPEAVAASSASSGEGADGADRGAGLYARLLLSRQLVETRPARHIFARFSHTFP